MRLGYLSNIYPMVSLSFIRREITELEARGHSVQRYGIRPWDDTLVDPSDLREQSLTRIILSVGALGLLTAAGRALLTRPGRLLAALRLALSVSRSSERGILRHLIYLAEACVLSRWTIRDRIEHLHCHFATNSATVAMLSHALGGAPYSFMVHGPHEFDTAATLSLREKIERARFVATISSFSRSQLYRWCDPAEWPKIHIVHCGLDHDFFGAVEAIPGESRQLLCIGRLSEQKGQVMLVEAARRLRDRGVDARIAIAGDGPLRPLLEESIARHELQDRVTILGWLTNAEVRRHLNESRALVLPSFAEGLPVVIMEALAMGRPVISTYIAGIPELVIPGENGWLVPAGDVDALVDAVSDLMATDTARLAEMGNAGAERVRREHDIRTEVDKLERLIADALPPPGPSA